jgi:Na+/H+ antiporter NhaD/arsenite permease-like protein
MLGAAATIFVAEVFYGNTEDFWSFVDFETLALLMGMMIIVGILAHSGFFEYLGVRTLQLSKGDPVKFFFGMFFLTAFTSAFLDNVTTVLLMTPLVLYVTAILEIDPMPFLLGEIMASNIGGTATLIGDPPNIMIGTGAGLSFIQFIKYETPISILNVILSAVFIYFLFRDHFKLKHPETVADKIRGFEPDKAIKDKYLMRAGLSILLFVIVLFFLSDVLGVSEAVVALLGGSLALFLVVEHETVEKVVTGVEWTTLLFFMSLFIIVGYLDSTGVLDMVASWMVKISGGNKVVLVMVILWGSALISAFVDNIPFTATMIPVINSLITQNPDLNTHHVLWWALSMGACLGGNGTVIGASANVVVSGIAKKNGIDINFRNYAKVGAPVTILILLISSVYLYFLATL